LLKEWEPTQLVQITKKVAGLKMEDGLIYLFQVIKDPKNLKQLSSLRKEAIESDHETEVSIFGIPKNEEMLWTRLQRRFEFHQYKILLFEKIPKETVYE